MCTSPTATVGTVSLPLATERTNAAASGSLPDVDLPEGEYRLDASRPGA